MKRHAFLSAAGALALIISLNSCGKSEQPAAAKPAAPEPVAEKPAAAPAPAPAAEPDKPKEPVIAAAPVDLNGFGSDEPAEREGEPERGVIIVEPKDIKQMSAQHWEQFDCTNFTAKRWGRYEVRVTYTLKHATLGSQFRFGQQPLKKTLTASHQPKRAVYGTVYIDKPGTYPFALFAAATGAEAGLAIHQVAFVPAPEGPAPEQAADGSVVLEAGSATTWSENMRYEPKPEKNCLGFWTSEDDFAEWDFDVVKPGRYKVTVVHGCGTGNEGSEVAVKVGEQELKFTVKDTGGFQKWSELPVGEVEIKSAGKTRLVIDPVTKAKSAVLDVRKVLLTPVG
ncbi:hypothetical protein [Prosthecobacter sp.]|uniref:DUF5077 domain-containing protein n=1 Tax=Prosthecobacter sp. TaxID=1965333 RepID=UPI001D63270B|nr:hypothetical protein [Prosthecobacter sp.]MCB1275947.1 hypothetical protein [Prosthecobacter sp.]